MMKTTHRQPPPPEERLKVATVQAPTVWIRKAKRERRRLYTTWTREMEEALGLQANDLLRFEYDGAGRLIVSRLDGRAMADPELRAEVDALLQRQRAAGMALAAQWNWWNREHYRRLHRMGLRGGVPLPPPTISDDEIPGLPRPRKRRKVNDDE